MDESNNENEERAALAPLHESMLNGGRALARCLDEPVVRAQLYAPEGIEPLRHEFRHAPSLVNATVGEIRCAVAIAEFSHTLESLVLQKQGELPKVTVDGALWIHIGNDRVPGEYFLESIVNAISCNKQAVIKLFYMLLLLVKDQTLSLPGFNTVPHQCLPFTPYVELVLKSVE